MDCQKHLGRVCVVGLGVTGKAVTRYLEKHSDRVDELVLLDNATEVEGIFDRIIISPGIAPHTPLFQSAQRATADLMSEIEFAYRESRNRWVAITGTNGKTTTTALVTHLLTGAGQDARAVGNIGMPPISIIDEVDSDTILVAEVSSFQLETCRHFAPCVATIINITPDHLDWHDTMDEYVRTKCSIFSNLDPGSLALINAQDRYFDYAYETAIMTGAQVVAIDPQREGDDPLPELRIKGIHNKENALFAREVARYFEVEEEDICAGLSSFKPVRHRLQYAGMVKGASWYNDSKATNPDATLQALHAFAKQRPIVLLGGREKGSDLHPLAAVVADMARDVVCFGEAGSQIADAFDQSYSAHVVEVSTMGDALRWAYEHSGQNDTVLLSPACASFDEFDNYEHRGDVFCAFVRKHADRG